MTHYAYAGVQGGKKVKGKIEATSLARARSALRQKRVRIKNIKELKEKKKGAPRGTPLHVPPSGWFTRR